MHANNELGNITDIKRIGELCEQYNAIFHSDTVQTMGHYVHDLTQLKIDFITAAAHKFHGPKGVGFLYINSRNKIKPLIYGGAQERNMRGGTENVYGIVGLAKAMELAYAEMEEHQQYIQSLKDYMKEQLLIHIPEVSFNGETEASKSIHRIERIFYLAQIWVICYYSIWISKVSQLLVVQHVALDRISDLMYYAASVPIRKDRRYGSPFPNTTRKKRSTTSFKY